MENLSWMLNGFSLSLLPQNLLACTFGVLIGTLTGILPGLGTTSAMALLLPLSFGMDPTTALIMLCGIYYGAMYGGSTTSILLNVPGESSSVMTCLDGYQMAKKGRAGAALSISALGSFVAGTLGIVGLSLFAPPLSRLALSFGPIEYFAIAVLGIVVLVLLSDKSVIRSVVMLCVGMMVGTIGLDSLSGVNRFSLGVGELSKGVDFTLVAMGLFGLGEVISMLIDGQQTGETHKVSLRELYPNREELRRSVMPVARGSVLGFICGLIPGPAAVISTFLSYAVEKKVSKHPEEFGKGAVEGLAGPESANNAASSSAMVPLLSLGLPFAPPTAILLSAFLVHNITPGPSLIVEHPDVFWGLIASMYVGNVLLVIINLPLVGVFAKLLKTPVAYLMPVIVVVTFTGALAGDNSVFDLVVLIFFGFLGYFMKLAGYEPAPLAIGVILGPIVERSLMQGMVVADGSVLGFFQRPLSGAILGVSVLVAAIAAFRFLTKRRHGAPVSETGPVGA